jgi:hypothetical protein
MCSSAQPGCTVLQTASPSTVTSDPCWSGGGTATDVAAGAAAGGDAGLPGPPHAAMASDPNTAATPTATARLDVVEPKAIPSPLLAGQPAPPRRLAHPRARRSQHGREVVASRRVGAHHATRGRSVSLGFRRYVDWNRDATGKLTAASRTVVALGGGDARGELAAKPAYRRKSSGARPQHTGSEVDSRCCRCVRRTFALVP